MTGSLDVGTIGDLKEFAKDFEVDRDYFYGVLRELRQRDIFENVSKEDYHGRYVLLYEEFFRSTEGNFRKNFWKDLSSIIAHPLPQPPKSFNQPVELEDLVYLEKAMAKVLFTHHYFSSFTITNLDGTPSRDPIELWYDMYPYDEMVEKGQQ